METITSSCALGHPPAMGTEATWVLTSEGEVAEPVRVGVLCPGVVTAVRAPCQVSHSSQLLLLAWACLGTPRCRGQKALESSLSSAGCRGHSHRWSQMLLQLLLTWFGAHTPRAPTLGQCLLCSHRLSQAVPRAPLLTCAQHNPTEGQDLHHHI